MPVRLRRGFARSSGRSSRPPMAPACALAPRAPPPCVSTWRSGANVRPSSWGSVMRSKVVTCALVASLWGFADIAGMRGAAPRFYPDDPLAVDNDRVIDVATAHKIDLDDYYDFLENSFGTPGDRAKVRAANVNTLDEV